MKRKTQLTNQNNSQRAALYVRVSTRYQVDKDSLPFQKKKLKEYLSFLGIDDFEIFEDDGYSAKNTDRPQYQRMLSCIRKNEFTHLLVWKVDRISRNLLDFTSMYEELKQRKVTFISLNEQFDTSTAMGETMLKIILIFAELERKMTAERVMGIMLDRAENGLWNGGHVPFGYKLTNDIDFPVPDVGGEADTIQLIFDKYEELHSAIQVSRYLYHLGMRGKHGGQWGSKFICDIIRNPFYIGTYRYNVRAASRGALKPESEWVVRENNHEAIISKEQFKRCNDIMDKNAETKNTADFRESTLIHIFSGKVKCGECGANMMSLTDKPRSNGFRPTIYRCGRKTRTMDCNSKTISEATLGPFMINYIANFSKLHRDFKNVKNIKQMEEILLSGDVLKDVIKINEEDLKSTFYALSYQVHGKGYIPDFPESEKTNNEQFILQAERDKIQKAIKRLMDLYLYDPEAMTAQEMSLKRKELQAKLDEIDTKLEELSSNSDKVITDISFIKKASVFLMAQRLVSKSDIDYVAFALKVDEKILKDFFTDIIERVEIKQGKVSAIYFTNGLVHHLEHKTILAKTCDVCGGRIGFTVSCKKRTISYKGKTYKRIKVGDSGDVYEGKKKAICEDCHVSYGRWHHHGCKLEKCPICGERYATCEHGRERI